MRGPGVSSESSISHPSSSPSEPKDDQPAVPSEDRPEGRGEKPEGRRA
jgi:hypothetical protein